MEGPLRTIVALSKAEKDILMKDWVVVDGKLRAARVYYSVADISSREPVVRVS